MLNPFNYLSLKKKFWKTQALSKKLECHFLVETTKIKDATFPYKTALLVASVKANRMGNTKWTCHKERSFETNYFIFSKILF